MNDTTNSVTDVLRLAAKSAAPYGTAMIGASHLNEAADTIDTLRAQLAEAQRELIAKEAQLAEARRDTERLDWIEKIALRKLPSTPRRGVWKFGDELIVGMSLRTAIDAAKGEQS